MHHRLATADLDQEGSAPKRLNLLSTVKRIRGRDFIGWGLEANVPVDAGLKKLKVIVREEDGYRKRVLVSRDHRDKRFFIVILIVYFQAFDILFDHFLRQD